MTPTFGQGPGLFGTPKAGENKPAFGSFSFNNAAPAVTPTEKPSETKTETKPSPFGGFSFSSSPAPVVTPTEKPATEEKKTESKSSPFAGFSFSSGFGGTTKRDEVEKKADSGMLFSLLAQQTPSTGFNIAPNKVRFL